MTFKDPSNVNKLYDHLKNCAAKTMSSPRFH
jgi:hypothetical protein